VHALDAAAGISVEAWFIGMGRVSVSGLMLDIAIPA
jgi:hypothetical protein